jgi:hypothetical protein
VTIRNDEWDSIFAQLALKEEASASANATIGQSALDSDRREHELFLRAIQIDQRHFCDTPNEVEFCCAA